MLLPPRLTLRSCHFILQHGRRRHLHRQPTVAVAPRVVVIGAGWGGLSAAKTYLQINPRVQLTIIDAQHTLGGVWSKDRIFPGMTADSPSGFFEFSDMRMKQKDWEDIPAHNVHKYLSDYADRFGLKERIRLDTRVVNCSKRQGENGPWTIRLDTDEELTCDKLIVASGVASEPFMPSIPSSGFNGPVIHSKDLARSFSQFTAQGEGTMRRIVVYGGCKSAIDAVIVGLEAGKQVNWVIREVGQGNGPGMMVDMRKLVFGIHQFAFTGRWKGVISPSIWNTQGKSWRFFHSGKSKVGSWMFNKFWTLSSEMAKNSEPYKMGGPNLEKLKPAHENLLYITASPAILHDNKTFFENLYEEKALRVHRASINSMSKNTVHLSNGETLDGVDGAIFATGWTVTTSNIFDPPFSSLPIPITSEDEQSQKYWADLEAQGDEEVLQRLPKLAKSPATTPTFQRPLTHTPLRLYRYVLPTSPPRIESRDLMFLGLVGDAQVLIWCEVSALWGISFLEGMRDLPKKLDMDKEIATVHAWSTRRYPGRGKAKPLAGLEIQDVIDTMMKDLGLEPRRKKGWFTDWFVPYRASDYEGIVEEFIRKAKAAVQL